MCPNGPSYLIIKVFLRHTHTQRKTQKQSLLENSWSDWTQHRRTDKKKRKKTRTTTTGVVLVSFARADILAPSRHRAWCSSPLVSLFPSANCLHRHTNILLLTVTVMVMVQRHSRTVANNGVLNIIDDHFALVVSSIISTGLPTVPAHCSLHHCSKSPVHLAPVATFAPATLLTRSVAKG